MSVDVVGSEVGVLLHSGAVERLVQRLVGPESGDVVVVPLVVDDLQNGASGEVVQISFLADPESAGTEPDGAPVVVSPVVVDLQAGSAGLD